MNKAIVIGNLARDPEPGYTANEIGYCRFTVAVNRKGTNQQGEKQADFIQIVAWRQLAELCVSYLTKGKKVCVVGQIQTRSYEDKDGIKKYVTEVIADEVEFLSPKPGDA